MNKEVVMYRELLNRWLNTDKAQKLARQEVGTTNMLVEFAFWLEVNAVKQIHEVHPIEKMLQWTDIRRDPEERTMLDVFYDACESAIEYSASAGCRYFVYRASDTSFSATTELKDNWLFRAYPGGRKQLSIEGVGFLKEQGIDVEKATRLKIFP